MILKIKNMHLLLLTFVVSCFLPHIVHAETYTTTENLFENNYTNNLIDMAQTQIENFANKKYALIQINYDYYIITADKKDVSVNSNTITMKNTKIIKAVRMQSGYNTYYEYSTVEENSTALQVNHIVTSNIVLPKAVSSKRYDDYRNNHYTTWLLVFILGLVFAIFLTKERSY